ncbi:hypothetical protein JCM6882_005272 [Rhodosporidiobolus microsporus]
MNGQGFLYGYPPHQPQQHQHQAPHSAQQPQPGLPVYPPANHNPYPPQDLHVDAGPSQHSLGAPGPSGVGLHAQDVSNALGGGDDDDDDGTGLGTPGQSSKKKGGRPRDQVWALFDGDRDVAKCSYCGWKTDHPKAFRMRSHVAACELIPQDKKDELARAQEEKEQKKQLKAEAADALGPGSASGAASAPKKAKRDHNGELVTHAGPIRPKMVPAPPPRSPITCHVLDSTSGKPAPEMRIRLDRLNTTGFVLQAQGMTDTDGRCNTLLPPGTPLDVGIFKITFFTNEYFTKRGILSFYPFVEIPFEVKSAEEHYHIPCLLSPYSYTTYRGS